MTTFLSYVLLVIFDFWLLLFRLLYHHFQLHAFSCAVGWGVGAYQQLLFFRPYGACRLSPISNGYFWVNLSWDGHPLGLEGSHCLLSPLNLLRAPSPIVVSALLLAMQHHLDQHLASYILSGLTNGFHIGFDHRCRLWCNGRKHPSTTEHPLIVQQHIEVKQARGSLVGALPPSWLLQSNLVPWGWVPKPHSDKW